MPSMHDLEDRLHRLAVEQIEAEWGSRQDSFALAYDRDRLAALVRDLVEAEPVILRQSDQQALIDAVVHRIIGLGPLEPYIRDPEITEIVVNGPREVFVERGGRLYPAPVSFRDDRHLLHVIDRIVSPLGRRIDESSPLVDARLRDGSRVNAIIPPLAIKGPTLTIRKFSRDPFTLPRLVELGTLSPAMAGFLEACVKARISLIVSGGTGSGKTSTLNALSLAIPAHERLITIEDTAELQLRHANLVALEARPPNVEGTGAVPIRELVRNALRMRPDRIIVGEVRGPEAFDMLQAMNTGHEGSLTTAHANSARDALSRLEGMVLMAVELPIPAIREQIGSALEVIVQQERLPDGRRKVTAVAEVIRPRVGELEIQEIFRFERSGVDSEGRVMGKYAATGHEPRCLEKIRRAGYAVRLMSSPAA